MLKKIDDAIYGAERALTVLLVAMMVIAVFVDVTHRKFSEPVGNVERFLGSLFPSIPAETLDVWLAPLIVFLLFFGMVYLAFRTAEVEPRVQRPKALGYALAVAVASAIFIKLLLAALPNGLIFSQKMALCFMLWVGFLGASMATREGNHIVFEVADRIWPDKVKKQVRWTAAGSAIAFCLFLAILGIAYTSHVYTDWAESDGVSGRFEGFDVPQWTVYGFLPIPFFVMAWRFAIYGVFTTEIAAPVVTGAPETKGEVAS